MDQADRRATLVISAGARAAEAELLDEVAEAVAARDALLHAAIARGDAPGAAALLAAPLRVVVPSRPLREHVAAALARRVGRAVAAVSVHTHFALALAAIERAGETEPRGECLLPVLVRRAAREEPVLARALGGLRDGWATVEAAARDLVDAGFEPAHAEALDEALAAHAGDTLAGARARAVVRAAARALVALEAAGLAPRAAVLRRASELLARRGHALLPTRALWIHGFADATGAVADWLVTLLGTLAGRARIAVPPDPYGARARESEFSATLAERFGQVASRVAGSPAAASEPPPRVTLLHAGGAVAEVRAAAARIRVLLDGGARPESIAIVARDLAPYRAAIAAQLERLAIPFSAHGIDAGLDGRGRRAAALARLLAGAEQTPIDVWLGASARAADADADLRVGLHVLRVARVADLAAIDLEAAFDGDALVLPVRHGASDEAEEVDDEEAPRRRLPRLLSRRLRRDRLEEAQVRARALVERLARWPVEARFAEHREQLEALLERHLEWRRDATAEPLFAALAVLASDVPGDLVLARDELSLLVGRAFEAVAAPALGGAGAGVQVLSVMSARGRTCAHLFVLGLERDVFPRRPAEDPLLPDRLRLALRRSVLPDLPVLARAHAEERHLFAELLSSSPDVTLSWQHTGDEGRERAPSSFVRRLELARPGSERSAPPPAVPRRASEHAVEVALRGPRAALAPVRAEALREVRRVLGAPSAPDVVAIAFAQTAAGEALDADRERAGPEPFLGFTGASRHTPRRDEPELFVTHLERRARCAWQAFLRDELGLAPPPDALAALPALSPLLRGRTLHAVLERVVAAAGAPARTSLEAARASGPVEVEWPDAAALDAIALEEARREAASEGIRIEGFAQALARWAAAAALRARDEDWRGGEGLRVLGAELSGEAVVEAGGCARRIGFRVDRADEAAGALRLTDYKTGNHPGERKTTEARRKQLLAALREGRLLQPAAYLHAARPGEAAIGRLLYLREGSPEGDRERSVAVGDAEVAAAFAESARVVLAAADAGVWLPRLVELTGAGEPLACRWCEVATACSRGESGPRRRLHRLALAAAQGCASWPRALRAAAGLLLLGRGGAEP